jgi:hypothetical protein
LLIDTPDVAGTPSQLYSIGTFQIASEGQPSSYVVGELWVAYHIRLYRPRLSATSAMQDAVFYNTASGACTETHPMSTSVSVFPPQPTWAMIPSGSSNSFVLTDPGSYLVNLAYSGVSNMTNYPTIAFGTNVVTDGTLAPWSDNAVGGEDGTTPDKVTMLIGKYLVSTAGTGALNTMTINGTGGMTSGNFTLRIFHSVDLN